MTRAVFIAVCVVTCASPARAAPDEALLEALATGSRSVLEDLVASGVLDGEQGALLIAYLEAPLELERASRAELAALPQLEGGQARTIASHRAREGLSAELTALVGVGGLRSLQVAALAPYVSLQATEPSMWAAVASAGGGVVWGFGRSRDDIDPTLETGTGGEGYVRLRAARGDVLEAGLLLTYEPLTRAHWDFARGQLVSDGPQDHVRLRDLYVARRFGAWEVVAGSLEAGFGEGLTFTGARRGEAAWVVGVDAPRLSSTTMRVEPQVGVRGLALHWQAEASGAELTLLAAAPRYDLFQEQLWYGPDAADGAESCAAGETCAQGFVCGADALCHSSALYDVSDAARRYSDTTYADAYRETLLVGQSAWRWGDDAALGVVAYGSRNTWLMASEASPRFAPSAAMPNDRQFGALGLYGRGRFGNARAAAELTRTWGGAWGGVLRGEWRRAPRWSLRWGLRAFGPRFENPHARVRAAADSTDGLAARNEIGGDVAAQGAPANWIRVSGGFDAWSVPWTRVETTADGSTWHLRPQLKGRAYGRVRLDAGRHFGALLGYDAGALVESALEAEGNAVGTARIRQRGFAYLTAHELGQVARVGIGVSWREVEGGGALAGGLRGDVDVTWRPWDGATVVLGARVDPAARLAETRGRWLDGVARWTQRLGTHGSMRVTYGVALYRDPRPWRYERYQRLGLVLERRL